MLTEKVKKSILFILILLIISFVFYNLRVFIISPSVSIKDFEESDYLVVNDSIYNIKGVAERSKNFYINNREIFLNTDYSFSENLYLSEHQNNFYIKSISKTGTVFEKTIRIYKSNVEN